MSPNRKHHTQATSDRRDAVVGFNSRNMMMLAISSEWWPSTNPSHFQAIFPIPSLPEQKRLIVPLLNELILSAENLPCASKSGVVTGNSEGKYKQTVHMLTQITGWLFDIV